jgi:hypothetical protein
VFVLWFYLTNKSHIIFLHVGLNIKTISRDLNVSSIYKYEIVAHLFAFRLNRRIFIIMRVSTLFLITDDDLCVDDSRDFQLYTISIASFMWLRGKGANGSTLALV